MKYEIRYSCTSHVGKLRDMNQDNFICDGLFMDEENRTLKFPVSGTYDKDHPVIFGVFDGMGGAECGEVASLIAAGKAAQVTIEDDPLRPLLDLIRTANQDICEYVNSNDLKLMGTTAAMVIFTNEEAMICNVGDSKIFRFRGQELKQISEDHVGIPHNGKKPPLSQCLGMPDGRTVIPHIEREDLEEGTTYLICSDGLTDMVTIGEITDLIQTTDFSRLCMLLQEKALEHGGRDNITIVLCRVEKKSAA